LNESAWAPRPGRAPGEQRRHRGTAPERRTGLWAPPEEVSRSIDELHTDDKRAIAALKNPVRAQDSVEAATRSHHVRSRRTARTAHRNDRRPRWFGPLAHRRPVGRDL